MREENVAADPRKRWTRRRLRSAVRAAGTIDALDTPKETRARNKTMRAAVFVAKDQINIREVPVPTPGPNQALVKVTLTTICGTDVDSRWP